jgi:hypothetical protein
MRRKRECFSVGAHTALQTGKAGLKSHSTLKNPCSHPQNKKLSLVMEAKMLGQYQAPDTENVPGQRQPVGWWKYTHLIK